MISQFFLLSLQLEPKSETMAKKDTNIRFEEAILRAAEYKSVVLGLIFLKYISNKFEAKMQRFTSELSGLFQESHRLEEEIRKQLGIIGFNL